MLGPTMRTVQCRHPSSWVRDRRTDGGKGRADSSDGSRSSACRHGWHSRFCRRSQLWNSRSQRKHVVGPA